MQITDMISITELSRITGKSRPTIYKYISDYQAGEDVPEPFKKLFDGITNRMSKHDIYEYCEYYFCEGSSGEEGLKGDAQLQEVIKLIEDNRNKINLQNGDSNPHPLP